MTGILGMTAEQEAFARHRGEAFVDACPGSGKTRTIIGRMSNLQLHCPPRRGIAVLSFTNSAVDEFRERCRTASLQSLLTYPSFMGTLDAFVRHFILLPSFTMATTQRPIVVDSWDALGIEIRLAGRDAFRGDAVSLDLFDPETNAIETARIGHAGLRNHVRQHQARYERSAALRRRSLLDKGYLSASDVRAETARTINDPVKGAALGRALAARFHEVIVDEGQDCNPADLRILAWLRQCGLPVTFVCDPNQAIYEFRHGTPLRSSRNKHPQTNDRLLD